jgi:hypothetical protein
MNKIEWNTDDAALKLGFPPKLTGGEITTSNGIKIVRFREEIKHNGNLVVCCLRVDTRPELAKIVADIEKEEEAIKAQKAEAQKKEVRIYLSSRGWGDYSACEWIGDITRPDTEILIACRAALESGHDVDQRNQSDDEILSKITSARAKWAGKETREKEFAAAAEKDIQNKIKNGYCFACETYCQGDCGHYSSNPMIKYKRDFAQAIREQNYGIND